jgi:negative elongation factor C/D
MCGGNKEKGVFDSVFLVNYFLTLFLIGIQGGRKSVSKDELKATCNAIEKTHALCSENKGSSELVADVGTLFQCLKYVECRRLHAADDSVIFRFPIAARGVLRWVQFVVSDASYFKLNTDHTPLHLVLLDEVSHWIIIIMNLI